MAFAFGCLGLFFGGRALGASATAILVVFVLVAFVTVVIVGLSWLRRHGVSFRSFERRPHEYRAERWERGRRIYPPESPPSPRPVTPEPIPVVPEAPVRPARPSPAAPDRDELIGHIRALDWFQFENAVGVLFGHIGYRVRRKGGANPDGGIDLELFRGNERIGVQCKHWKRGEVGVKEVREFAGALLDAGIQAGILVGTGGFTAPARDFASRNRIELCGESDLAQKIIQASGWSDPLFRSAFVSPRKDCPKCGSPLVERVARRGSGTGRPFYGCSRFPTCRFTMPGSA